MEKIKADKANLKRKKKKNSYIISAIIGRIDRNCFLTHISADIL